MRLIGMLGSGARSEAERRAVALLRDARIGGWAANVGMHDEFGLIGVGDLVFSEAKVVVEIDGWAYHSARAAFERDRSRQNRLVAAGWTVLRFTWRDLSQRPDHVVRTVRALVDGG
ncbi:endonuclease domain-containing protein [Luedemannella flava]